jgi:hypothetical protein
MFDPSSSSSLHSESGSGQALTGLNPQEEMEYVWAGNVNTRDSGKRKGWKR